MVKSLKQFEVLPENNVKNDCYLYTLTYFSDLSDNAGIGLKNEGGSFFLLS